MSKNINLLSQSLKNEWNNDHKVDLKKKSDFFDSFNFNRYSIQACMMILFVSIILLFAVLSIATTPNPSILFGV